ncbi:MAG: hypothetical protein U0637_05165 [Phycisphaerales bacterium]
MAFIRTLKTGAAPGVGTAGAPGRSMLITAGACCLLTATCLGGGVASSIPSQETQTIYVSSSTGLDTNSGLSPSTPKRTLGAAYMELRNHSGDQMLLRRGDTWTNETLYPSDRLWGKSGYSNAQPIVVGAYGSGARPVIRSETNPLRVQTSDGVTHFRIENLDIQAIRTAINSPQGVAWWATGGDFTIRDCRIQNFAGNIAIDAPAPMTASGFHIERTEILDAFPGPSGSSQGAYVANVFDVLFDGCLVDRNGYRYPDRMASMLSHNLYLSQTATGVVVRNCVVARGAATGIQMRGQRMDSIANLVLANPLGITMGHSAQTAEQVSRGVIYGNTVIDGGDIGWGDSRLVRGFGISWGRVSSAIIEDNIVAHGWSQGGDEPAYTVGDFAYNTVFRHNVGMDWLGPIFAIRYPLMDTCDIGDNTFVNGPGRVVASIEIPSGLPADVGGSWLGNKYWGTGVNAFQPWQGTTNGLAVWEDRTDDVVELNDAGYSNANISMPMYLLTTAPELPTPSDSAGAIDVFLERARAQPLAQLDQRFTAAAYIRWARQRLCLSPLHAPPQLP